MDRSFKHSSYCLLLSGLSLSHTTQLLCYSWHVFLLLSRKSFDF
uniref:Uncharacterized protein n=1 Tax=Rhizophora mucronata TaxID=61149 RepID=A0A2P2MK60_RHIMU